ncbi:Uma2 family endonuclease [Streptomyces yaanensis]|uniref:Uma2 family endonuclease n=1 Tax=Streptomyces yaanensis TaxID=1142239 RepID=A0ABV7SDI5_9ACTN|nr:Uma2 family endonuclease [Streptomyces sp. CGMCC 4.7035]WNB96799.1 Uma2 family endonuclease [Streptomyces sp. CGMCC 4.7035]
MAERPVISGTKPRSGFEELLDLLDELHVPDGYKAEIIRGSIVLSPWSKGYYTPVMKSVCNQLEPYLPEGHVIERTPQLFVFPGVERGYGPDIHAAHERVYGTTSSRLDGEGLSFVAELTSTSTRDEDLTDKAKTYGQVGVPIYLVLDMQEEQAFVYGSPSPRGYEVRFSKPFGEKLYIPDPFGCELDTNGFQAPSSEA